MIAIAITNGMQEAIPDDLIGAGSHFEDLGLKGPRVSAVRPREVWDWTFGSHEPDRSAVGAFSASPSSVQSTPPVISELTLSRQIRRSRGIGA